MPLGGGLRAPLCPPPQGLMWDGGAPSPAWRQSHLDPSVLFFHPARQTCPHSIFLFGLSFLLVLEGQAGSAFPGAPAQALTGGHEDRMRHTRPPGSHRPKQLHVAAYLRVCLPERGPRAGAGEPRPPGRSTWSGARPYYSRSSVEMLSDGQTTKSKCRYRCLYKVMTFLSLSFQEKVFFICLTSYAGACIISNSVD